MKLKLAILSFVVLAYGPAPAVAQQLLGSAQSFAVLGNTTVTSAGAASVWGNLGVSPGTAISGNITIVSGAEYTGANAVVVQAQADAQAVYNTLVAETCPANNNLSGQDLGGITLTPGVYCFAGAATLTAGNATLTLDAQNGPGVFVFQIGTTITTAANSAVKVINGSAATGVFWQIGSSATLGAATTFAGNMLANTSITIGSASHILCGRALALNGAVSMPGTGQDISDNCTGDNFATTQNDFGSLGFAGAHTYHDLNADGAADVLWRNSNSGQLQLWEMAGSSVLANGNLPIGAASMSWQIAGVGDFTGTGFADLLWFNSGTSQAAIWLMNGSQVTASALVTTVPANWSVAGVGDFNGDGMADILWYNSNNGAIQLWEMNGTQIAANLPVGNISTAWQVAGVGDFNADGMADILWFNSTTGQVVIWLMNGNQIVSSTLVTSVPAGWSVAGVGDFNGDGMADVLWYNSGSGAIQLWEMNGTQITSDQPVGIVSAPWQIAAIGDYNADGMADILWHNSSTGATVVWLMNGNQVNGNSQIGAVTTDWTIVH